MFISHFKARANEKPDPLKNTRPTGIRQEADDYSPEYAATDDGRPPGIDTKRVHDRAGGDFYISY